MTTETLTTVTGQGVLPITLADNTAAFVVLGVFCMVAALALFIGVRAGLWQRPRRTGSFRGGDYPAWFGLVGDPGAPHHSGPGHHGHQHAGCGHHHGHGPHHGHDHSSGCDHGSSGGSDGGSGGSGDCGGGGGGDGGGGGGSGGE